MNTITQEHIDTVKRVTGWNTVVPAGNSSVIVEGDAGNIFTLNAINYMKLAHLCHIAQDTSAMGTMFTVVPVRDVGGFDPNETQWTECAPSEAQMWSVYYRNHDGEWELDPNCDAPTMWQAREKGLARGYVDEEYLTDAHQVNIMIGVLRHHGFEPSFVRHDAEDYESLDGLSVSQMIEVITATDMPSVYFKKDRKNPYRVLLVFGNGDNTAITDHVDVEPFTAAMDHAQRVIGEGPVR